MRFQRNLIHETDWKTLIIIDACRFDYFNEVVKEKDYDFNYESVWSAGSDTGRWYDNTWYHRRYNDTVLISDSPVPWRKDWQRHHEKFHKSYPLWKERGQTLNTFLSLKDVCSKANKLRTIHGNKRTLIHLIPPHLPYYTEDAMKWLIKIFGERILGNGKLYDRIQLYGRENGWSKLKQYYKDNITVAIDELLKYNWGEKTIITSDHGELIGENGRYTHSLGYLSEDPKLRTVPWVTLP